MAMTTPGCPAGVPSRIVAGKTFRPARFLPLFSISAIRILFLRSHILEQFHLNRRGGKPDRNNGQGYPKAEAMMRQIHRVVLAFNGLDPLNRLESPLRKTTSTYKVTKKAE